MALPTSMVRIALRAGTSQDALRVAALATQVFLDTYATHGIREDLAHEAFSKYSPARFADRLADDRRHFILAERDDHLLGFAELARQPALATPDGPDGLELVRLDVQPPFHRRGIGRALLQEAESQSRALKAGALWLSVWSGNQRGLGFYRSRGYKDAGTTRRVVEGTSYENRILLKQLVA
jgi:ribosomal protein S18 acetylase RimI-like enzyme